MEMAIIQTSPHPEEEAIKEAVSEMESINSTNDYINGGSEIEVQMNEETKVVVVDKGTRKSRNRNPGVRKVGNRVYDSENGKTCHQCRQKTMEFVAECKKIKNMKACAIKYCHRCLSNRYDEKAEEVGNLPFWDCPKCRGICNCSLCRKKKDKKLIGRLENRANENVGSSPNKRAASEMDSSISTSRKKGVELATVCRIKMPPEDVGKALQFLGFCAAFGEVLEVKNGHPESILRDLIDGQSSYPGRSLSAIRFHIRLISLINKIPVDGSPNSSDSWVRALKECIYGSEESSKLPFMELLDKGSDGYGKLNSSQKLTVLNMLCDEVLNTEDVRDWIDFLFSKHTRQSKKEKKRVHIAKDTINIEAHGEMLELIGIRKGNKTRDALRPEILPLDKNGHVYWRLKCLSSTSGMLVQG